MDLLDPKKLPSGIIFFLFLFFGTPASAANDTVPVGVQAERAEVILIIGAAKLLETGTPLARGDFLTPGDRVRTEKDSRVALKMPDGSYARFDELTTFQLTALKFDNDKKQRNIDIRMILGKAWAKVAKFLGGRGRFAISTRTAIAGVRGTVYRMNVYEDNSASVKVYWGEILVEKKKRKDFEYPTSALEQPAKVSGPTQIPGPHPVSMEEWTYILKALQQINIRPDGSATKPFRFSIEEDLNDWVRWNQQLDEALGDR